MPDHRPPSDEHFRTACFVIMPFGTKVVGAGDAAQKIDFDWVYDEVFEPAIAAVDLPEDEGGGHLRPVRSDRTFHSGIIGSEMFADIEYSRFALADITGLNANVFYELGVRHRAYESGTAIFRQEPGPPIPFDINQVRAFPYRIAPEEHLEESRALVTRVLTESLRRNAWDSPVMVSLRQQRKAGEDVQKLLLDAENAVRQGDASAAHDLWLRAAEIEPNQVMYLKASALPKSKGKWDEAIRLLHKSLACVPASPEGGSSSYSEAQRELGIAMNKRDGDKVPSAGEGPLRLATHYNPDDYDAWASLGGVLRKAGRNQEALGAYEKAVEVSHGHPYPTLMAVKLRAHGAGTWALEPEARPLVERALGFRKAQVENAQPMDTPWSYFDLAEAQLYLGDPSSAIQTAKRGLAASTAPWMPDTFHSALELLPDDGTLPGLAEIKEAARARKIELEQAT